MNKRMRFLALMFMFLTTVVTRAQFTVIDAESKETLAGVYVFSESGKLLTMSNENGEVKAVDGNVTLSMMSYEPLTLNATGVHGQVPLKPQPYQLTDVVVRKTEYVKVSAAFRDVVSNHDKVSLYREGIVDYYYNNKNKKWTRRIRACRQYEHPELRHPWVDTVACWSLRLLDFNKVQTLKQTGSETVHGDTTIVGAMKGKTEVKDGVMIIRKPGIFRTIIDNLKFANKTSGGALGMNLTVKKMFTDWTYVDNGSGPEGMKLMRLYQEQDFRWSKKSRVVPIAIQSDIAVFDTSYLTKNEAKEEMGDKTIVSDFVLPDCLPAVPPSVIEQGKKLTQKSFHDF